MKFFTVMAILFFLASNGFADDQAGPTSALPADAVAQVNELKTKMRYFKAIGFHKQSKEARDEIIAIYEKNGVSVPEEYLKDD